jgi:predicted KAP-like P-loop ATPase
LPIHIFFDYETLNPIKKKIYNRKICDPAQQYFLIGKLEILKREYLKIKKYRFINVLKTTFMEQKTIIQAPEWADYLGQTNTETGNA